MSVLGAVLPDSPNLPLFDGLVAPDLPPKRSIIPGEYVLPATRDDTLEFRVDGVVRPFGTNVTSPNSKNPLYRLETRRWRRCVGRIKATVAAIAEESRADGLVPEGEPFYGKRQVLIEALVVMPVGGNKTDLDNKIKTVLDPLQGSIVANDWQFCRFKDIAHMFENEVGCPPCLFVRIRPVGSAEMLDFAKSFHRVFPSVI